MSKNQEDVLVLADTEIEPYTLVHDILSNWWVILLGALAAAMLSSVFVSVRYEPKYTTQTTFVVVSKTETNTFSNLSSANTMATTFQKVLESSVLQKTVCEALKMERLDADIEASVAEGTNLMTLTVTADNPKDAIDIIHAIMDNYDSVALYTVGNAVMEVLKDPEVPYEPTNPLDTREARKKGFLAGALVIILLLGVMSVMKNTVKQEKEIERKLDGRSLGEINYERKYKTIRELIRHRKNSVLVDQLMASFGFVENYKKLATKIQYQMGKDNRKVLVVTSVAENEGKSTVAANIALTLAEQSKRVILIDGDIRKPSQFLILGLKPQEENEIGRYLSGEGSLKDVIMSSGRKNLHFIGGRRRVAASTEMLGTDRLDKLLAASRKSADYVIIDTPPAGLIGDAQIFANHADAVLLVARQNYMLAEDINEILDDFRDNNSKVLGIVLNGVKKFAFLSGGVSGNYYGRYGRYGNYRNYRSDKKNRDKGK